MSDVILPDDKSRTLNFRPPNFFFTMTFQFVLHLLKLAKNNEIKKMD